MCMLIQRRKLCYLQASMAMDGGGARKSRQDHLFQLVGWKIFTPTSAVIVCIPLHLGSITVSKPSGRRIDCNETNGTLYFVKLNFWANFTGFSVRSKDSIISLIDLKRPKMMSISTGTCLSYQVIWKSRPNFKNNNFCIAELCYRRPAPLYSADNQANGAGAKVYIASSWLNNEIRSMTKKAKRERCCGSLW